jgi:hypothetical protein
MIKTIYICKNCGWIYDIPDSAFSNKCLICLTPGMYYLKGTEEEINDYIKLSNKG